MAMSPLTIVSNRAAGQAILLSTETDRDGPLDDNVAFAQGIGDILILEAMIYMHSIATLMTNPEFHGPRITVTSGAGGATEVDFVGVSPWIRVGAARLAAHVKPDQPVFVRTAESFLYVAYAEVDTNGAPTDDVRFLVRARLISVH